MNYLLSYNFIVLFFCHFFPHRAGRIFWSDVMTKQLCQADIDQTSITNVHQLLLENASMIGKHQLIISFTLYICVLAK